jgi:hypothetical protein
MSAENASSSFTSVVIAAIASRRASLARAPRAGAAAGGAAAWSSSARARVMPQWHASARSGTRRPQEGHVQVCAPVVATIPDPSSAGDPADVIARTPPND